MTNRYRMSKPRIVLKSSVLAGVALFGYTVAAQCQQTPSVMLNGGLMQTSVPPIISGGSTLVPMRAIFQALGANVKWDGLTQGITAHRGTTDISMQIGNRTALVNGQEVTLNQPPQLYNGSTMVPLRFVSEAMGAHVKWDGPDQQVIITTDDAAPVAAPTEAPIAAPVVPQISIPAGAVVPITLDVPLSSGASQVGQTFTGTVRSQQLGDSEFPPNTKIQGLLTEVVPGDRFHPGVLSISFQGALLPDGTQIPIAGDLISLDSDAVAATGGHLVANMNAAHAGDPTKIVGVMAGPGFLVGHALQDQDGKVWGVGGSAGPLLYDRKINHDRGGNADLRIGAKLGVRLNNPVTYNDTAGYAAYRFDYEHSGNIPTYFLRREQLSVAEYDAREAAKVHRDRPVGPGGPPQPAAYDSLMVPAGVVVPVTLDRWISSTSAQVGQVFTVTVSSQQMGDSEFPAGSKLEGVVIEARPRNGDTPGMLDFDFRSLILPDGTRYPIAGRLAALDSDSVVTHHGRIIAKDTSGNNRSKVMGIGAGAGYVVGHLLLKKNGLLSALVGAAGGFLFDKSQQQPAEAVLKAGTPLGVLLDEPVTYTDRSGYGTYRDPYLRM